MLSRTVPPEERVELEDHRPMQADVVQLVGGDGRQIDEWRPLRPRRLVMVRHQHAPLLGGEEPGHVVKEHGLARSAPPDDGDDVPRY